MKRDTQVPECFHGGKTNIKCGAYSLNETIDFMLTKIPAELYVILTL